MDGAATLVYGYPKRNELDYMQGDAVTDYQGTCALTAIANLLTQADRPTSEASVVQVAINNQWAITDPNRPAYERQPIISASFAIVKNRVQFGRKIWKAHEVDGMNDESWNIKV